MKLNHKNFVNNKKSWKDMHQNSQDAIQEEMAGFEKFEKRQRSMASPSWKGSQKIVRLMKEVYLNNNQHSSDWE